jgi:hypothetical protein
MIHLLAEQSYGRVSRVRPVKGMWMTLAGLPLMFDRGKVALR